MSGLAHSPSDTIAAIATPSGKGGVGIVRISGSLSRDILGKITGKKPRPRYAEFALFRDADRSVIDQGLVLYFESPASFTGEDVLELHAHGGPVVMDMLMARVLALGARLAMPGEFTQRAFLNDKIDLLQAEAIADLIDSHSRTAARFSARSLQGEFSGKIHELSKQLIELRMFVESSIDFPEEEVDFLTEGDIANRVDKALDLCSSLLVNSRKGARIRQGIKVVLTGEPNVGKSSLMNRLSQRETAIVTSVPGTTRDLVREEIDLDGLNLELVDTAGIRDSRDPVEEEGIRRALEEIRTADLVILLLEATDLAKGITTLEREERKLRERVNPQGKLLAVRNKTDLLAATHSKPQKEESENVLRVSALTGEGLDELVNRIKKEAGIVNLPEDGFIARTRHVKALEACRDGLTRAQTEMAAERRGELVAEELRQALSTLSEMTGEVSADDLLGEIFSRFCIGK